MGKKQPMRRLVTDHQPFNGRIVTTASPEVLGELAEAFAREEVATAHRLVSEFGALLGLRVEGRFEATFDYRNDTPFRVALPEESLTRVAEAVSRLKALPDHSEVLLSEILDLPEVPQVDWVLRVEAGREDPERDYVPEGMGGMWDVVLYHPRASAELWGEVWASLVAWAGRKPAGPVGLFLEGGGAEDTPTGMVEAELAFGALQEDERIERAVAYLETPFFTWYGESHDWVQAWFNRESLQLIVHDRHAATGHRRWDLENFFAYRDLIARAGALLGASRVLWGLEADSLPMEESIELSELGDPARLFHLFGELHAREISEEDFGAFASERPSPGSEEGKA